jgi:hypothetical protein
MKEYQRGYEIYHKNSTLYGIFNYKNHFDVVYKRERIKLSILKWLKL